MICASRFFASTSRLVVTAVCLSSLSTACTSPRTVMPGVPTELKHSWEVSFNRGDAEAVASLYTLDGQLLMSGAPPVRGKDSIKRSVQEMIATGAKVKIDTEENVASGDIAYVFGKYRVVQGESGPETEHGTYVEVWRRRDGVWRISLDVNATGVPDSAN